MWYITPGVELGCIPVSLLFFGGWNHGKFDSWRISEEEHLHLKWLVGRKPRERRYRTAEIHPGFFMIKWIVGDLMDHISFFLLTGFYSLLVSSATRMSKMVSSFNGLLWCGLLRCPFFYDVKGPYCDSVGFLLRCRGIVLPFLKKPYF